MVSCCLALWLALKTSMQFDYFFAQLNHAAVMLIKRMLSFVVGLLKKEDWLRKSGLDWVTGAHDQSSEAQHFSTCSILLSTNHRTGESIDSLHNHALLINFQKSPTATIKARFNVTDFSSYLLYYMTIHPMHVHDSFIKNCNCSTQTYLTSK